MEWVKHGLRRCLKDCANKLWNSKSAIYSTAENPHSYPSHKHNNFWLSTLLNEIVFFQHEIILSSFDRLRTGDASRCGYKDSSTASL